MTRTTTEYQQTISVIDTYYSREKFAASHLILQEGKAAFVDVGTTPALKYLLEALSQRKLTPADVEYIILTHIHLDHAGGAGALMQVCPNARLVVHPKGMKHMINPEKLVDATIEIYGKKVFGKLYEKIIPIPAERLIGAIDELCIDFHGRPLHFIDTPGHARHHCCIWDPCSKGIFSGDTMGLAYPELQIDGREPFLIPTTSPVGFEPEELKKSIKKLQQLKPDYFYLTHYGPILADTRSVQALLDMIDRHTILGCELTKTTKDELPSCLLALYHEAFSKYKESEVQREEIRAILAGDIQLNSQGLLIWAQRQRKNTEKKIS